MMSRRSSLLLLLASWTASLSSASEVALANSENFSAPTCNGTLKRLVVDFEKSKKGKLYTTGQTPDKLPGDIRVRGRRTRKGSPDNSDLMIYHMEKPSVHEETGLAVDENHVLVISEDDNPNNPKIDEVGGKIVFRFKTPIYQVNAIKILGITQQKGRVIGRTSDQAKIRADIPVGDTVYVHPSNWYDIKKMRINLFGPGAIAELDLTYCDELEDRLITGACPAGQERAQDGDECVFSGDWSQLGNDMPGSSHKEVLGQATKISGDGKTVVVGYGDIVRVFRRDASSRTGWSQIGQDIDEAGTVVDISVEGDMIAANGSPVGCDTISAYRYNQDFDEWVPVSYGGRAIFAQDVNLSGDGSLVIAGSVDFGLVGIFALKDDSWDMVGRGYLEEFGSSFGDFGGFQTVSSDGTAFAVGYTGYLGDTGSVTVYRVNGDKSDYAQLGTVIVGTKFGERFGTTIALSKDGTTIAVASGLPSSKQAAVLGDGSVTVYRYISSTRVWEQVGQVIKGADKEELGSSIALSDDGSMIAVGCPGFDSQTGRAQTLRLYGNEWVKIGQTLSGERQKGRFGSVSMSGDGSVMAVGAPTTGAAGLQGEFEVWGLNGSSP